jgi:hypothetical protein
MTIDKSALKAMAEKCLADQISIDSDFHDELSSGVLDLLADLDEAENGMKHSCAIRLKKEIERLQAENESLRKDAGRYLWLLKNWFTMSSEYKDKVIFLTGRSRWSDLPEDAVSDAIDEAISKESAR